MTAGLRKSGDSLESLGSAQRDEVNTHLCENDIKTRDAPGTQLLSGLRTASAARNCEGKSFALVAKKCCTAGTQKQRAAPLHSITGARPFCCCAFP